MLRLVATSPYSRLPVYRGTLDRVIGILHTKDVVFDYIGDRPRASIAALLRPILRVRETMPADRLLAFMRDRRSHHALVEDDDGRISGLITLEDVVGELLGGVSDEFKVAQLRADPPARRAGAFPGAMRLDQAAPVVGGWGGSPETVASHIVTVLGRFPEPGEQVSIDGLDVEIEVVEAGHIGFGHRRTARRSTGGRPSDGLSHHRGTDPPERDLRGRRVRHRRRAAVRHRRACRAGQPSRAPRAVVLGDPQSQDRYIATAQLGITVASLGLGMYGEHVLADGIFAPDRANVRPAWLVSHGFASVVAIAILTYFHIVIGEMVPKSLALHARRADGALDHAADAVDQDAGLSARSWR